MSDIIVWSVLGAFALATLAVVLLRCCAGGRAPDAAKQIAIIDRALLDDLLNGIGAEAERLFDTFFEETERRLAILQMLSIDARDAIYLEAHTLKGSCGMVGLKRMSELARELEHRSATIAMEAYRVAVDELAHAYVISREELARHLLRRGIVPAFAKK